MERRIKFRAWSNKEKVMIDWFTMMQTAFNQNCKTSLLYHIFMNVADLDDIGYRLMQYTGLEDKNGKEIYEGDILIEYNGRVNGKLFMEKPYIVEYTINKGYPLCMPFWDDNGNSLMDSNHYCEVIGNIYENPEIKF